MYIIFITSVIHLWPSFLAEILVFENKVNYIFDTSLQSQFAGIVAVGKSKESFSQLPSCQLRFDSLQNKGNQVLFSNIVKEKN